MAGVVILQHALVGNLLNKKTNFSLCEKLEKDLSNAVEGALCFLITKINRKEVMDEILLKRLLPRARFIKIKWWQPNLVVDSQVHLYG